jgi:hypothetical protein
VPRELYNAAWIVHVFLPGDAASFRCALLMASL